MSTEFEQEDIFTAEDFEGEGLLAVRPMNADEINRAALAAVNSLNPVENFTNITQERAIGESSQTEESLRQENIASTREALAEQLPQVLGDESLSLEQKQSVLASIQDDKSPMFDQHKIAVNTMASKPLEHEELNREEQAIEWAANLNEWSEFTRFKQKALAHFTATRDPKASEGMTFLMDFTSEGLKRESNASTAPQHQHKLPTFDAKINRTSILPMLQILA